VKFLVIKSWLDAYNGPLHWVVMIFSMQPILLQDLARNSVKNIWREPYEYLDTSSFMHVESYVWTRRLSPMMALSSRRRIRQNATRMQKSILTKMHRYRRSILYPLQCLRMQVMPLALILEEVSLVYWFCWEMPRSFLVQASEYCGKFYLWKWVSSNEDCYWKSFRASL